VARIADASASAWRASFDTNVFSCVAFIQAALPALRESRGRIVVVSSGAAVNAYTGWGAYGAAKAALNHLVCTMEKEEGAKGIVAVAVRPGVVDTEMQRGIREVYGDGMEERDVARFRDLKEQGGLLRPEQPGNVLGRLAVEAVRELGGRFFKYVDFLSVTTGICGICGFFRTLVYFSMAKLTSAVGTHPNFPSFRTGGEKRDYARISLWICQRNSTM
jgi:NAD(P)-dependent dehydrogenase (short-subunit alcohol dehydrogenase family)